MKTYIFRIDEGNKNIINSILKKGELRQGWGASSLALLDSKSKEIDKNTWIKNCNKTFGNNEKLDSKYNNLKIMLKMKVDDIVIIPKVPNYNSFIIAKISKPYSFSNPQYKTTDNKLVDDFFHLITLDFNSMKIFKYSSNQYTEEIHSSLRGYQRSINNVYKTEVITAANELLTMKSTEEITPIEDIFKEKLEKNLSNIKDEIYGFRPEQIEKLVEKIFCSQGYVVEKRNKYNRKGGDADLILKKFLPVLAEIDNEISFDKIYIQVKNKDGENFNDEEGLLQLENIVEHDKKENNTTNIYKVLVCTTSLSQGFKEKARELGIITIDGLQLTRLALKFL